MVPMTKDRILELDLLCGARVWDFLANVLLSTINHEDNVSALAAMARELELDKEELISYSWLQLYIKERDKSSDGILSLMEVATLFHLPMEWLRGYICDRADCMRKPEDDDDFVSSHTDATREDLDRDWRRGFLET